MRASAPLLRSVLICPLVFLFSTDACMVPSDSGPCRAAFNLFYFDPSTSSCQSFIYGGCQGNSNRYGTLDECMARCTGEHGKNFFPFCCVSGIKMDLVLSLINTMLHRSVKRQFCKCKQSSCNNIFIKRSSLNER